MDLHEPDRYPQLPEPPTHLAVGCFGLALLLMIRLGWWAFDRVADLLAHVIDQ